jgi:hypothetical protein
MAQSMLILSAAAPTAATIFYLTLLIIFITAILTTVVTKWSRDKCLKFFDGYHVTLERMRGQTSWGTLRVFSSGIEIVYDQPFTDSRGRRKTSFLLYGSELDPQLLTVLRYHDELTAPARKKRDQQVRRTFNPGPLRRAFRGIRNVINTLRDAFSAAIGAFIGQYQRMNPAAAGVLATQSGNVTALGQSLLGKIANAYEPLLEQYIGQPVIVDVLDPINPNHATVQYAGYLADYTQAFLAIFNVQHSICDRLELTLPDIEHGPDLGPLPAPPPSGMQPIALPPPLRMENELAIRIDGYRFRIQNMRPGPVIVRRLQREGFEPIEFGMVIPSMGHLELPARDARGGVLFVEVATAIDVVAPRRAATIRHAGELVERRGLIDEIHLDRLPLVPTLFRNSSADASKQTDAEID